MDFEMLMEVITFVTSKNYAMKLFIKFILAAMLLCVPFGVDAQGTITRPKKPKKQTTAAAKKQQKPQANLTPEQMHKKGDEAFSRNNNAEALKWYRKAAEKGYAPAQYDVGRMYDNGFGVAKNQSEAARWFRMAAEQGDKDGIYWLAFCYKSGQGVAKDSAEAARWYRKGAENGDTSSMIQLAIMCYKGDGIPKDYSEAYRWFSRVSQIKDSEDADFYLGRMYELGNGVPMDKAEAKRRYQKIVAGGGGWRNAAQAGLDRLK